MEIRQKSKRQREGEGEGGGKDEWIIRGNEKEELGARRLDKLSSYLVNI